MTDYYVYVHIDDKEVVYVGKGKHHRAWCPDNRCEEHREWMIKKLPYLRVGFEATELSSEEALELEKKTIRTYSPKWNRQHNGKCDTLKGESNNKAKLTEEEVVAIKYLLAPLMSGTDIAKEFGIHKSSVYKIINNQNWDWL